MPHDRFGRQINYLRVSLIDHCNLRCVYCMPLRGVSFERSDELLTAPELEMVVRAAANVGFHKIRLTGGEPTLRADLVEIVERIAAVRGIHDLSMTTNAILLPKLALPLQKAGLRRVNIHADALDPTRLRRVMRFNTSEQVWAGIEAADAAGFNPLKLNAVMVRGFNEEDAVELARLTLDRPWHARFRSQRACT